MSACSGGGEQVTDSGTEFTTIPTGSLYADADRAILQAVYFDIRIPAGFYTETYADSGTYYSISNVKNDELLPVADRLGIVRYELSSNDFTEALAWSEQAASHLPVYKQLVDNSDTDLYFEFLRVDLNNPQFVHKSRVLKTSALDRSGIDLNQPDSYQGKIGADMLTAKSVKMILEYLWTFSFSNNTGSAVLSSNTIETETSYIHTMEEAKLTTRSAEQCDTVAVFKTTYTVQKASGDIWKEQQVIKEISSKYSGSEFEICSNEQ
ncbi:MAG: hypothetical protein RQ936_04575 [Gammaproteobacteria bacterium]|nr:hypothetical protein [Gammaproteobacteria bacterium]